MQKPQSSQLGKVQLGPQVAFVTFGWYLPPFGLWCFGSSNGQWPTIIFHGNIPGKKKVIIIIRVWVATVRRVVARVRIFSMEAFKVKVILKRCANIFQGYYKSKHNLQPCVRKRAISGRTCAEIVLKRVHAPNWSIWTVIFWQQQWPLTSCRTCELP